jgi:hypothetical protein
VFETRRIRWNVFVPNGVIDVGAQMDFTAQALEEGDPWPQLVADERLAVEFPDNTREEGRVKSVDDDAGIAVIKVAGRRWKISRATPEDNAVSAARGMRSERWIVRSEEEVPGGT